MKRLVAIVAIVVLALAIPDRMLGQESKAEQQIHKVSNENMQAMLKGDTATLDRNWVDEFIVIQPNGTVLTKAENLARVSSGGIQFTTTEELDSKIRIYGKTAVMTTTWKRTGSGDPLQALTRNTYIFVKRDGRWQAVLRQMTSITPASALAVQPQDVETNSLPDRAAMVSNADARHDIEYAIRAAPELSNTNIWAEVTDDGVILSGCADYQDQKPYAVRRAEQYAGDRKVVDQIRLGCLE